MIIFLIFFKTDKHQLDGFLFHIVFDHDFDFAADVLVEQKLNHFVFILKIVIESRADHMWWQSAPPGASWSCSP